MIDALKPAAAKSNDPWAMATLGEAYLALGEFENAARWFGTYANDPNVDAFALSGTVRQLEEVWRLKAGPHGAGAIVAGLKAALIRVENGQLRLDGGERRALAQAGDAEFKDLFELESKTPGRIQIKLADLQRIVRCASAVAGIKKVGIHGADTVGTGFLINGSDFGPGFSDADSYLLTNAHVLWNPDWAPERNLGRENDALLPAEARIVFETDQNDGRREVYTCKQVIWQSPSSLHDATLIQLDRKVAKTPPLQIATKEAKLVPDYDGGKGGTKLVVIGHPEGGPLSLGISGSIEEMQATLLDKGTRANASDPVFLHYRTPTEPGNSGSPVFEVEKWQVVGLHHAGFPEGGRPKLGGKAGRHAANEGIWIESVRSAVMEHVKAVSRKGRRKWFG